MHYVRNCQAIEKLFDFGQCDDIKGASIAVFIINALNYAGLNPQMCRAQTYDWTGNMTGKEKGAAAKFCSRTENEKRSTLTAHQTNLTYLCLKHPKSWKLWLWLVRWKCWVYFLSTHQDVNETWNNLLQKLLLNHFKRKSNHCVKQVGWKGTQHLQI